MIQRHSFQQFITDAHAKFMGKFDYSQADYHNYYTHIDIVCPSHGKFKCAPAQHLKNKHGCDQCGTDAMAAWQRNQTRQKFDEFLKNAPAHYDYSCTKVNKMTDKIDVRCKEHGIFSLTLDHHLRGVGCKKCADLTKKGGYCQSLFNQRPQLRAAPGILYVLRMSDKEEEFIKIGITRRSVKGRYRASPYQYEIIEQVYLPLYQAYSIETHLKEKFKDQLYRNRKRCWTTESFECSLKSTLLEEIRLQLSTHGFHINQAPFSPSSETSIETVLPG